MTTLTKRATIYLEPALHRALRLKSIETSRSLSDLLNDAVRAELVEDAEDLGIFDARKNEMQRLSTQGKALEAALDRNNLHEAERKARERELLKLNQDFQRLQREFNEDRNTRMNEEIAAIQERARQAIKQIAEAERFDLILQQNEVLYRSPRMDITERVIKLLDR